jgi:release factor glutamine methyltransferase
VTDIREAGERLRAAGVPSPEHDARTLIRYAEKTGADPDGLLLARASRIPLQHLLGTAAFRYLELRVAAVLAALGSRTATPTATATQAPVVVDLCAGSGAIGLSVAHEHPDAVVHLVESSPEAFDWLARNAARATPGRVHLHLADLAVAPSGLDGAVDVVVSNPPYLPLDERASVDPEVRDHDPALALWAQDEGLAVVRRVVDRALTLLRPGGTLVVEHSERHVDSAPALLGAAGFVDVAVHDDLTRRPRYTTGRRAC